MKNLNIIATNGIDRNKGRLFMDSIEHKLVLNSVITNINWVDCEYYNIYITNNEKIKEGDWILDIQQKYVHKCFSIERSRLVFTENDKKIILTTDQNLIKNGIQAIDDKFLEWFVNNPSCKDVKVDLVSVNEFGSEITVNGYGFDKFIYKIIIPKEKLKQETLEEVAKAFAKTQVLRGKNLSEWDDKVEEIIARNFTEGAKWQQEQDENKYSEEEVRRIAEYSFHFHKTNDYSDSELADEWELRLEKMFKNQNT